MRSKEDLLKKWAGVLDPNIKRGRYICDRVKLNDANLNTVVIMESKERRLTKEELHEITRRCRK